jgi:DNA-directed RNA polymerase subunit RPC12/RpoP
LIQFACPSCKATCSVDDKFKGRKIKCPKCGARVVHVKDNQVELLTAGKPPDPLAAPAAPDPISSAPTEPVPTEATPVATAVVPHLVKELVQQPESKQNLYIAAGLLGLFTAVLTVLGIVLDVKLLVVAPIALALSVVAVWLWMRKKKLEKKAAGLAKTESVAKV